MKQYLERNRVLDVLHNMPPTSVANPIVHAIYIDIISLSLAKVEPVKTAYWTLVLRQRKKPLLKCSLCGGTVKSTKLEKASWYCPHCGAHMVEQHE